MFPGESLVKGLLFSKFPTVQAEHTCENTCEISRKGIPMDSALPQPSRASHEEAWAYRGWGDEMFLGLPNASGL